ncbi:MAG: HAD-IA family hydrolase [Thermodesulfovibrionales bacterium]
MSLRLIIFDLDGTLIDSSPDIADAINYAVGVYGLPPVSVKETIGLVGEGISRLMEKLIEKEGIPADRDLLVGRFLEHYSAHLVDKTTVYPGVRETLERLAAYKKAVISNKREGLSGTILQKLGLAPYLDIVVGSDTTQERKPSPVPVRHVLSRLGIRPDEAVMVGDSTYDIEAGRAAGLRTVAVTYGYRSEDVLQDADFIIDSLSALPDIAGKLSAA